MTARYTLYFAPRAAAAWASFGARALVGDARRYGFHATLKAPFRLARSERIEELIRDLDTWCATQTAFPMPSLVVAQLDDFVALVPEEADARLNAIAAECMLRFERWRALPGPDELAHRLRKPLSERQHQLLERWGYPYVLDQFRFHLSLTGPLGGAPAPSFEQPREPMVFDGVTLCWEPGPGADFRVLHRSAFRSGGRLIYVAGPSGAGKDSVLDWVKRHLRAGAPVVFARRTITRPAGSPGEDHIAVTPGQFAELSERGEFAMDWGANGHRYGISQEIRVWLAQGLTVVASGSREYLAEAERRFPGLEVVHVTAQPAVLRRRLLSRKRESADAIERRLRRAQSLSLSSAAIEVVNDGDLDRAGRELLAYLGS